MSVIPGDTYAERAIAGTLANRYDSTSKWPVADGDPTNNLLPARLIGANFHPATAGSSLALGANTLYVMKVPVPAGTAFEGVSVIIATAGATLTANQSFVSVYHPDGTLMAQSRDQSTLWTTTGAYEIPVVAQAGQTLKVPTDGYVYVGIQSGGTTRPAFARLGAALAAAVPAGSDTPSGITIGATVSTFTTPPAHLPRLSLQPPGLSGTFYAGLLGAAPSNIHMPVPAGDSSGNLQVKDNKVFYRVAARETGYLEEFAIAVRAETGAPASYFGGTGGTWLVRFYGVDSKGYPDFNNPLNAGESFNPRTRENADSTTYGTADNNLIVLPAGFYTKKGQLFTLVVSNTDASPLVNYASCNFVYNTNGLVGAQSRNELSDAATDVYYGLDPREGIGLIWGDGSTHFPCGSVVDASVIKHVPCFIQGYSLGRRYGQPYFSVSSIAAGAVSTTWRVPGLTNIKKLGCFMTAGDSFTASLVVNGTTVASGTLTTASGGFATVAITPVTVGPQDVVKVQATTTVAGSLSTIYPGAAMKSYWLQRTNRPFSASGTTNLDQVYDTDNTRSVPLYPIGWPLIR